MAWVIRVHSINNCVVLGKHCLESTEAAVAVGFLASSPGPVTRDQGKQWYGLELVAAGGSCRTLCSVTGWSQTHT